MSAYPEPPSAYVDPGSPYVGEGPLLVAPCVCGRAIVAQHSIVALDSAILEAVQLHNATPEHQRWRERGGFYGPDD